MAPVVPCPVVVGRTAELDTLAAALDVACAGNGEFVFVLGEAGIGKSRLAQEVAAMASSRRARVLHGRAVSGSGSTAFRPLAEALAAAVDELGLHDPELRPWLPALAAVLPTVGPPSSGVEATPPVLGEAVLRLLRWVCAPGGGLLVLEDLHWADPETLAVVEHLSDNLDRAPVLCVATVRSDEASPARNLARRAAARRSSPVLELRRLTDAQVAALAFNCTGGTDAATVDRLVELADGVPLFVEELLVAPGLPSSFAETVEARLAPLPEPDRRVLVTAAAFGRHFDWTLLAAASGLDDSDVVEALDRGVGAQLLAVDGDGFRFRHALTAEAVFQSVIPPRRTAIAAAALDALVAAHPEPAGDRREVAARLAERAGQAERAGDLLLMAGQDALARGALRTAVAALEGAANLLPPGDRRDAAAERLVEALALVGRVDDALEVGTALAARLPPARAGAVQLRLAGVAVTASRWESAAEQLASARVLIESSATPGHDAELALRDAEVALGTSDTVRAEEYARTAVDRARDDARHDIECAALLLLGRCARRRSLGEAEGWFRRARSVAEAYDLTVERLRAMHEEGTIALLDRADVTALLEAQELADSMGAMATAAILNLEIAVGLAEMDDLDGHRHHALDAVRRGSELGLDVVVAYGWQHLAANHWLRGELDQAEAAAAAARAAAPGNRDIDALVTCGGIFVALLADDREQALDAAEQGEALFRESATAPPAYPRTMWPLLLALKHHPEAAHAVKELEQAGLEAVRAGRAGLLMASAIIAGWEDPNEAAALAVEADNELVVLSWWRSVLRRFAAEAAAAAGWAVPDTWLPEAEAVFRRLGFNAMADSCRSLRSGSPPPVAPAWRRLGVTPREADVLKLLIEGCANREIAERLFLSTRTVEKHVESLLRKTGARSRTQLARLTATTEDPAGAIT